MGKIKGWERTSHVGNLYAWNTIDRPFLSIWIEKDMDFYIIKSDFGLYVTKEFPTKEKARKFAVKYMKTHPRG